MLPTWQRGLVTNDAGASRVKLLLKVAAAPERLFKINTELEPCQGRKKFIKLAVTACERGRRLVVVVSCFVFKFLNKHWKWEVQGNTHKIFYFLQKLSALLEETHLDCQVTAY